MDDELRILFQEKLKADIEALEELAVGTEERQAAIEEIEKLSKALNEDLKVQQAAYDNEESRRVDEDIRNKQVEAEHEKSKLELIKGLGMATITGIIGVIGIKTSYHHIYKMEAEGLIPNREAVKLVPKLKFW